MFQMVIYPSMSGRSVAGDAWERGLSKASPGITRGGRRGAQTLMQRSGF